MAQSCTSPPFRVAVSNTHIQRWSSTTLATHSGWLACSAVSIDRAFTICRAKVRQIPDPLLLRVYPTRHWLQWNCNAIRGEAGQLVHRLNGTDIPTIALYKRQGTLSSSWKATLVYTSRGQNQTEIHYRQTDGVALAQTYGGAVPHHST